MSHFEEILTTIGASECKNLNETPNWAFWRVTFATPVQNIHGYYLYLKHKCPLKEGDPSSIRVWRSLNGGQPYDVVITPNSQLLSHLARLPAAFGAQRATTTRELVRQALLHNTDFKPQHSEPYFIEPDIEIAGTQPGAGAVSYITDWLLARGKNQSNSKSIAVLRADGGTGKTTVAREIVARVRKLNPRVFPLLIESEQWRFHLQSQVSLQNLWDIAISRILTRPGPFIANETAFRVLVKEGLFVIIFDGFDELCLHPHFGAQPSELINELLDQLASEEETAATRILLTTRSTYWETFHDKLDDSKIEQIRLLGFSNEQRKNYFHKRLKDQATIHTALRYASQVGGNLYTGVPKEEQNADRLSGTPFILDLIAQAIEDTAEEIINPYSTDPLEDLVRAVCKREDQRQTLGLDADKQIELFEELFREQPNIITRAQLDEYVEIICGVADSGVKHRFTNHFFLTRIGGQDSFQARYEILRVYFIARFLSRSLLDAQQTHRRNAIAKILADSARGGTQILDWVVEQLSRHDPGRVKQAIIHARQIIKDSENVVYRTDAGMALFDVTARLMKCDDKNERSRELSQLLSEETKSDSLLFVGVCMVGQIKGFDFTGAIFRNCVMTDVNFRNCVFIDSKFDHCRFEASLELAGCNGLESIVWNDCTFSTEAELAVDRVLERGSRVELRKKLAEAALERALRKFRGRFGFESLRYSNRVRGMPKANPFSADIWSALERAGIVVSHTISGVEDGGLNVVDDVAVRREVMAFFDNRTLGPRMQQVIKELLT